MERLTPDNRGRILAQLENWKHYTNITTACIRDVFKLTHSQAYRIKVEMEAIEWD